MYPVILGVSVPAHDADELRMYRENSAAEIEIDGRTMSRYEWSQEQRRIETAVRAQKDIAIAAKASGDDAARREAQAKINALQDRYEKVSKAAGLDLQRDRMRVAGFRSVKTVDQLKPRTEYGTMKPYGEMLESRKMLKNSDLKNGLPIKSDADSISDLLDDSGKVLQRRVYGKDGKATTDFDTGNHNRPDLHPTGAHKHSFNYSKKRVRGINLPLTDADLRRNADIIKRGDNYFDEE